jgi:hypothetical protein
MTYVTRRRTLRQQTYTGSSYRDETKIGRTLLEFPWGLNIYDRQVTISEGHRWPEGRGVRDVGGNFDTVKLSFKSSVGPDATFSTGKRSTPSSDIWYVGDCLANINSATGPNPAAFTDANATDATLFSWVPSSSESQLVALGTGFIADTIPTNPTIDGSVSLAELYREGIPHVLGSSLKETTSIFRTLGSEYLSFEFGWKPFVSDLKNAAKAIIESDDILQQLERDSGRNVRRHRSIPRKTVVNNVSELRNTVFMSGIESLAFSGPTTYRVSDLQTREQSFSGCYTFYYEPALKSQISNIATQARLLYGLDLTPEVIWNLAPWSWLIDWVADVGPVMHNLSAFSSDGLVLRYGYVMEENFRRVTRVNQRADVPRGTDLPREVRETFSGLRKTRRKATPYGFGLDFAGFSTRQWSILGALGITLAPRRL